MGRESARWVPIRFTRSTVYSNGTPIKSIRPLCVVVNHRGCRENNRSLMSIGEGNDCCATARGRRLVNWRSTAAIVRGGQGYGRASGRLLHAKPNVALPTLAVDRVVFARRLIGKVMTVGAQAIGSPVVQCSAGGGGLSVNHFAHCKAGSAGAFTYGQ